MEEQAASSSTSPPLPAVDNDKPTTDVELQELPANTSTTTKPAESQKSEDDNLTSISAPSIAQQIPQDSPTSSKKEEAPASNKKKGKLKTISCARLYQLIILYLSIFMYQNHQFFLFNLREIKRRKLNYCIGVATVFIVVFAIIVSGSVLAQISIIFLRLAENQVGETDLVLTRPSTVPGAAFNFSQVQQNIMKAVGEDEFNKRYSFMTPRSTLGIAVYIGSTCVGDTGTNFPVNPAVSDKKDIRTWMYKNSTTPKTPETGNCTKYCVTDYCERSLDSTLVLYDHILETKMVLGRNWDYPKLDPGAVYMPASHARSLGVTKGDIVIVELSFTRAFEGALRSVGMVDEDDKLPTRTIYFPVTVADTFVDPLGKLGYQDSSHLLMDYRSFFSYTADFLDSAVSDDSRAKYSEVNFLHHTDSIIVNLPPNRIDWYSDSVYDNVQKLVLGFGADVLYFIGFDQLSSNFPLIRFMYNLRFISMFSGLAMNVIVTVMACLSIVLIYSLLMINVENRRFEMGVMRLLGVKRFGLIHLILMQSLFFALPAVIAGVITGQLGYLGLSYIVSAIFKAPIPRVMTWQAAIEAVAIGLIIPIVASILPIIAALGTHLSEALDTRNSKTAAVTYKIDRASESGLSMQELVVSAAIAIIGFAIYYFMPLSLITFNLSLLLYGFFAVLLGMLLGLVTLSLNVESILNHIITIVFFFWENEIVRSLIQKNLIAHRVRNRKTTIIYGISLGFVVFAAVMFNIQILQYEYDIMQGYGARFNVQAQSLTNKFADPKYITLLEGVAKKHNQAVQGFAYSTYQLADAKGYGTTVLSNGLQSAQNIRIRAISPTFFDVLDNKFLKVSYSKPSALSLSQELYTAQGSSSIILGTAIRTALYVDTLDQMMLIQLQKNTEAFPQYYYHFLKPLAFLSASPGASFTEFAGTTQDAFVSFPTYARLANYTYNTTAPIQKMYIRTKSSATDKQIDLFKEDLRQALKGSSLRLIDMQDELQPLSIATELINFAMIFITIVIMLMCFFSLFSSMYTNIYEQSKEIGVLRAIGARPFLIVRLYIYESFTLVLAASIIGLVIGTIVAFTITIQQSLFTQLPIDFIFPWQIGIAVIVLAFVFSILAALIPILQIIRLPITTVLKRLLV